VSVWFTAVSTARRALVVAAAVVALTACQTGERPSFDTSNTSGAQGATTTSTTMDDVASSTVEGVPETTVADANPYSALFATSADVSETAVYEVRQTAQQVTATVTVSRMPGRTLVDVRGFQFRDNGGAHETCNVDTQTCEPDYAEQRLSDLQISSGFWGPAIRRELNSPTLASRIGPVTTSDETIAGEPVTCVNVPGPSRSDRYCALATGMLAEKDTAAVTIDLVEYRHAFAEDLWNQFPA